MRENKRNVSQRNTLRKKEKQRASQPDREGDRERDRERQRETERRLQERERGGTVMNFVSENNLYAALS